jgi:DNA-binding NarL/FixJ family response regulator
MTTGSQAPSSVSKSTVVIIEERALIRDCLVHCVRSQTDLDVAAVESVQAWKELSKTRSAALFVICTPPHRNHDEYHQEFQQLLQLSNDVPTIVLSDGDEPRVILEAIERGAKGYIPTSVSLAVAIAAMRFVSCGGVFVPAASLLRAVRRQVSEDAPAPKGETHNPFTARQIAVIEALRKGKANKLIAYELNMCESTVKVHVRKIMKKLKATNRTQVAFLSNQFMNGESAESKDRA